MPLTYAPGGSNKVWVYAKSPHTAIAGDILYHLGTEEIQVAWATIVGVADPPMFPQAAQKAKVDPLARKAFDLFDEQLRLAPSPAVRNPDVAQVEMEQRPVKPNAGETIQGIFTGQLKDVKRAMQELQERMERELDRAIEAARKKGAQVSRDDWVFPNWDPLKDYTEQNPRH